MSLFSFYFLKNAKLMIIIMRTDTKVPVAIFRGNISAKGLLVCFFKPMTALD